MLFRILHRIDRSIQTAVDETAFFFMRRGIRKSFIRYTCNCFTILAGLTELCLPETSLTSRILGVLVLAAVFYVASWSRKREEGREDAGVIGGASTPASRRLTYVLKLWSAWEVVFHIVEAMERVGRAGHILFTVYWFGLFLNEYLWETPNSPPPSKDKAYQPAFQT